MRKFLGVLFLSLCLLINTYALANDTALSGVGDNVGPFEGTPDIVLDKEVLNFTIYPDKTYAEIYFYLRNEGPETNILIGFPDEYASYQIPEQQEWAVTPYVGPVTNFKAWVNSIPAVIQEKHQINNKIVGDYPGNFKVVWHVWPVIFPANKTTVIRNTYYVENGIDVAGFKNFHYTLVTGAKWKGNIGKTVVNLKFKGGLDTGDIIMRFSEKNIQITGPHTARWEKYNFEPRHDNDDGYFHLTFKMSLAEDFKTRNLTEEDLKNLSHWELKVLRNEIYARHGRAFKTDSLAGYFATQNWYKIDPGYSDSRLNSFERRNAQFILNYEKKVGSKIIYKDQ